MPSFGLDSFFSIFPILESHSATVSKGAAVFVSTCTQGGKKDTEGDLHRTVNLLVWLSCYKTSHADVYVTSIIY